MRTITLTAGLLSITGLTMFLPALSEGWLFGREKQIESCVREETYFSYVDNCTFKDRTRSPEIISYKSDKVIPPVPDPGILPGRIRPFPNYKGGDNVLVNIWNTPVRRID